MSPAQFLAPFIFVLAGCAATKAERATPVEYPGVLRAPEALAQDVLWRQRVTAFWGEGEQRGFDAVIQKVGDKLTVLGLSPAGSVGFAIVLHNGEIELTNKMPDELPFPPRNVMLDVQRAFYPWLDAAADTREDGIREGLVDGERIVEIRRDGRLLQRNFTRLDGNPAGTLSILYAWGRSDWGAPTEANIENAWFGYRLRIETYDETLLEVQSNTMGDTP